MQLCTFFLAKLFPAHFEGHLIVDTCLNSLLFSFLKFENKIDESRLEYISNLFDISNSSLNDTNLKEITSDSYLLEMQKTFQELKEKLAVTSKTCKLWIEYQNMVYLARKLIEADRNGRGKCTFQPFKNAYQLWLQLVITITLSQHNGTYKT